MAALGYLALANLVAFAAMGLDKSSARRGGRRIPERTLLTLAAIGGGPGAVLAQQTFRHKTRKQPFAGLLYAILIAQLAGAAYLLSGTAPVS
ncbi:MAG: DUF1294 domain-containing protein [Phenylobacterium sp.]|uniref:DUF1294 domain-containing protein n=1 Tax=Phenylobacterium sp. TaxID=1871053 RepID=UPI0025DCAAFF|nr:DUF1294 domain-containing protein [Phenylobacterium sp.]MBA4013231.1 DUF1294 domain-containing protein [Phenylobacterium sp.]